MIAAFMVLLLIYIVGILICSLVYAVFVFCWLFVFGIYAICDAVAKLIRKRKEM